MRPIPRCILTHNAMLRCCNGVNVWQNPEWLETPLNNICMQPANETRRTRDNTEVVLRSLMFVDAVRSEPVGIDFDLQQQVSEANGQPLTLTFEGREYTVLTIEKLYDQHGVLHHWEVGLV